MRFFTADRSRSRSGSSGRPGCSPRMSALRNPTRVGCRCQGIMALKTNFFTFTDSSVPQGVVKDTDCCCEPGRGINGSRPGFPIDHFKRAFKGRLIPADTDEGCDIWCTTPSCPAREAGGSCTSSSWMSPSRRRFSMESGKTTTRRSPGSIMANHDGPSPVRAVEGNLSGL